MFERYTEQARRALFFARYESSTLGVRSIETEHLLLGLLREHHGLVTRLFERTSVSVDALRAEAGATRPGESFATSVEIPFSEDTKRALVGAAEEADREEVSYIGTEHLLLGLLRDPSTRAGAILAANGLQLDVARKHLVQLRAGPDQPSPRRTPAEMVRVIDEIRQLVSRLVQLAMSGERSERKVIDLADQIERGLDRLKPESGP
jgi:ATP-dependent Clp protease ATP-binding subunit ClpC